MHVVRYFFFFFFRLLGYFYKKDTALILFSCISNGSTAVLLTVQETNGMEYQNTEHLMLFTFFLNLIAFCFPRLFFFFFFFLVEGFALHFIGKLRLDQKLTTQIAVWHLTNLKVQLCCIVLYCVVLYCMHILMFIVYHFGTNSIVLLN